LTPLEPQARFPSPEHHPAKFTTIGFLKTTSSSFLVILENFPTIERISTMAAKLWIPSDIVTLIAWIEFCHLNGRDFTATIIQQLRESRQRQNAQGYPFTLIQVKNKLIDLAREDADPTRKSKGYARFDEIISKGSACFPRLTREHQSQVDAALEHFQESHARSAPGRAEQFDQESSERNVPEAQIPEESELVGGRALAALSTPGNFSNMVSLSQISFPSIEKVLSRDVDNVK
jgi:hypothetical protein